MAMDMIVNDPAVQDDQPIIRGTRLTVRCVLTLLAQCPDREELRQDYPQLDDEAIRQALAYAAANLEDQVIPLRSAS